MTMKYTPTTAVLLASMKILVLYTSMLAQAQQEGGTITGTATSGATGEPLPGVNVVVVGTQQEAATGADGAYTSSLHHGYCYVGERLCVDAARSRTCFPFTISWKTSTLRHR
jgi:hypothetical protein